MKTTLTILTLLGTVACSSGTEPSTTSTSLTTTTTLTPSTVTTNPSPTTSTSGPPATSTPATSSTIGDDVPSTDVLSPDGFWEVRVGETVAENESRIGGAFDDLGGDRTACLVLQLPEVGGVYFIASTLTGDPVADPGDLVVGRVSAEEPGLVTDNGIEVGMSVADAESTLGSTITERRPHTYVEGGEYVIVGPEDHRYIFETDGDSITAIHAGIEPVVSYVEACS